MRVFAMCVVSAMAAGAEGDWRLRLIDGTGIGDVTNTGVSRMAVHDGALYIATWNTQKGSIVYRSRDGEAWEQISEPGIGGGVADFAVVGFVWYGGKLYAGTWNQRDGAAMYRANADTPDADDIVWETITTAGFDNPRNWGFTHMRAFKGHLYAGCFNFMEGSEVWRSATGDPGAWEMVSPKGWGAQFNTDSTMMITHGGYLYVGTESARDTGHAEGTQLWRTDGNLAPPYDQWEQVNANGFGNARNHNICGLAVLGQHLYAGTWNETQGLEVWRARPAAQTPFDNWERVASGGFNSTDNVYTTCMTTFDDSLFVASIGRFETNPALFFLPNARTVSAHGGRLMKTRNGTNWEEIDTPGFADPPHAGIQWITPFNGRLYVGMHAFDHPAQLWVYEPGADSRR